MEAQMTASLHRVVATSVVALAGFAFAPVHAERLGYTSDGYGTYSYNASKVTSSPTALVVIGCRAIPPVERTNTAATSHAPGFTAGETDTSVDARVVNGVS